MVCSLRSRNLIRLQLNPGVMPTACRRQICSLRGTYVMPLTLLRQHALRPLRTRRVSAAAALILATSCIAPLEPADVAGTYVYAPPGGLRFEYTVAGMRETFTLAIHDTLVLRADGTGLISGSSAWVAPPPDAPVVGPRTRSFTYTLAARTVRTRDTACPAGPDCLLVGLNARFTIFGPIVVRENGASADSRAVYRRVGPPAA